MIDRAKVSGVRRGKRNRKIPRRSRSPSRKSLWVWIAKGTLIASGIAAAIVGSQTLYDIVTTSPRLAIESIDVTGDKRVSADTLIRLSGIKTGENILRFDSDAISTLLRAHPWVASARVLRRFPRRVEIQVVEHEPKALVALGHFYYADREGRIVKRYAPGERERLPVITGLTPDDVEAGDGDSRDRLRSAIDFVDEVRLVLGDAAPKITEIHLDTMLGLSFEVEGSDLTVDMGVPPWTERIQRLKEIEEALKARGVRASHLTMGGSRRRERAVARLEPQELVAGIDR